MNDADDLPGGDQLHLQRHSACGLPACWALGLLGRGLPACSLAIAAVRTARNLVSRWYGHLVKLQLQPQGMCLVQLLRTQLEQPRSDWEASWPRELGQEEEGLSDGGNACCPR